MSTATIDKPDQADRQIPASAARFVADGMFQFAAAEEGKEGVLVRLHARDAQPIAHWYWGKIAHDMSGVIHRDRLAIDWLHDSNQILGYVDQVTADSAKGLDLAGRVLTGLDEKAAEIAAKAAAGVPYESSIDWTGPAVLEYVETGMEAEVNGYTFKGPGYIARKWNLRGVAICPHGADMSTTTEFAVGQEVGITVFTHSGKGVVMPTKTAEQPTKDTAEATPVIDQAAAPTNAPAVDATKDTAGKPAIPAQKFVDAFGPKFGYRFYGDGLSYEDAAVEFGKAVAAERDEAREEAKQLRAQVATLRGQMGEADAATFTPEGATSTKEAEPVVDENFATFKAGITLPTAKSK